MLKNVYILAHFVDFVNSLVVGVRTGRIVDLVWVGAVETVAGDVEVLFERVIAGAGSMNGEFWEWEEDVV